MHSMSKPLTIVAIFQANPGREGELAQALQNMVAPTVAEAGCLNYDLHQDLEVPGRFLFYENWETRAHWEAHLASDHLLFHQENSAPLIQNAEILQMESTGEFRPTKP